MLTIVVIGLLIALLYRLQIRSNASSAYESSRLLINQIRSVIDSNEDSVRSLTASLREDYVTRSRAVSYIIDRTPAIENQITELAWLTNLVSVDEIHLFDSDGKLYSGTKPQYYGENLKTSKTFSVFAKMLTEKNFTMCETITNEVSGKSSMMYAICWNESHKRLVMIGITPMRLMNEMSMSQIDKVIREIPAYEGTEIMVADNESNEILGATSESLIGKTLTDEGLKLSGDEKLGNIYEQSAEINGEPSYCSINRYKTYKIVIARHKDVVNKNILVPLVLVCVYMLLAATVIVFIVRRMTKRIINEHNRANTDAMTSFFNKRAYEDRTRRYDSGEYEPTLVYVSMDLNGLKTVNDTMGHTAGDKLICGAAACMKQCFGNYGELFRVGGDEFTALIFADEDRLTMIRMDFAEELEKWSAENDLDLSVSCGYVRVSEVPGLSFAEIAKLADDRMYENKDEYYQKKKAARRRD